jgi:hypothetical protein
MLCSQAAAAKQQQPKRPTQLDRLHHLMLKSELPRASREPIGPNCPNQKFFP